MEQIIDRRFFVINTENNLSSSNNVYSVSLQIPDYSNYDKVVLLNASMPISYYLVQANGLNTFQLKEDGSIVTVTVPPGNYSINSFSSIVSPLMNAASPNGLTYTMTYNDSFTQPSNGLYTITANSSAHSISLIFTATNTVNEQFGFNEGAVVSFTNGIGMAVLVSTNVVQFTPENVIQIHSNICDNKYDDILEVVTNQNNVPFSYINYQCPDPASYCKDLSTSKSQAVSFSMTNEHGIPIYFNGSNVSFTVMLFKTNKIYKQLESVLKYMMQKEQEEVV